MDQTIGSFLQEGSDPDLGTVPPLDFTARRRWWLPGCLWPGKGNGGRVLYNTLGLLGRSPPRAAPTKVWPTAAGGGNPSAASTRERAWLGTRPRPMWWTLDQFHLLATGLGQWLDGGEIFEAETSRVKWLWLPWMSIDPTLGFPARDI
jgi:hypothetical protein